MVTGAVVMSFFATIWFALGMLGAGAGWATALIGLPVSTLTILAAIRSQRGAPPRTAAEQKWSNTVIGWASAFEGVTIPIAIVACANLGRPDLTAASIAVIVGLHFLPMAYFLKKPGFYASAAAMLAIAIAGTTSLPDGTLRATLGPGCAAVLWATCWVRAALTRQAVTAAMVGALRQ